MVVFSLLYFWNVCHYNISLWFEYRFPIALYFDGAYALCTHNTLLHLHVCTKNTKQYIYIYIERERERERDIHTQRE